MKKIILSFLFGIISCYLLITLNSGCAQISAPTGGAKDTLPPRLVKATPELNTVNFKGNKVTLSFDEYIDLQELQGNLIISPLQKTNPVITYNLKSISIKFKDTLLPNTTYSINFGNSIKDVHEGNILRDFTYVFSTGNMLDSLTLEGNVVLAESGKTDSTIIALLYRNLTDSAVLKTKPDYITKLDGEGNFTFNNLPDANFKIYALKDGDGGKTYNAKTELFAFDDSIIKITENTTPVLLYAYAEQKADINKTPTQKPAAEKKLRYTSNLSANTQDLLESFELTFNNPLKKFDSLAATLTDTNYRAIQNYTLSIDSSRKIVSLDTKWQPESDYLFILPKNTATDSLGYELTKNDTIRFKTKKTADYGSLLLRFTNTDLSKNPVIQFLEGEKIKFSFPIVKTEWSNKLFPPGEYAIRILYDLNNNGIWDPGNYSKKIQPEKAIQLPQRIAVKADWENERDIKL